MQFGIICPEDVDISMSQNENWAISCASTEARNQHKGDGWTQILDVPPQQINDSRQSATKQPLILRAFYATHIQIHCLDGQSIDPLLYGFEESDRYLLPSKNSRVCPDDLIDSCTWLKCATISCTCRKSLIQCCSFCKCHSVETAPHDGRNPYSE